ncbi:hypothetical protein [Treponema pedis]|uniref:hypothetical protein n=2 Tax=Treponema pedis TaxID=409322 RepID=UPI003D1D95F3
MKVKFHFSISIFLLSLFLFFSCKPAISGKGNGGETVLKRSEQYFSALSWTESETILKEPLPEPFQVKDLKTDTLYKYGDTDLTESIFPSLEGLGVLDYSGIDPSLISFFNSLTIQIKKKQIKEDICVKGKVFLPFMINYKLKLLKEISSIFYSRPEYNDEGIMIAKFRCNIKGEKKFYTMLEIGAVFLNEKWQLDSFDIIGDTDAGSIE